MEPLFHVAVCSYFYFKKRSSILMDIVNMIVEGQLAVFVSVLRFPRPHLFLYLVAVRILK